jgi:hypothetical protein
MNALRTLIMGVMAIGAMAIATPAQAHDRDHDGDRDRHHHHHHHWRDNRETVVIDQSPNYGYVNDSGVTVAFGGHRQIHHRHRR